MLVAITKTERLHLRVSSDQKHLLEQAAVVVGMSAWGYGRTLGEAAPPYPPSNPVQSTSLSR